MELESELDLAHALNEKLALQLVGMSDRLQASVTDIRVALLRELAKDTRVRGDIGKPGGVEAWDYLDRHADRIAEANT